ncbi:MAG TPA: PGPGW domain-containing protein [Deferrisomatales bacterium]|nr:PGPGW domain-containing protein [Deferrisomatales bacterium]
MIPWLRAHEALLWWLGFGSAAMFLLSLSAVPWLVVRIPPDYFTRESRPPLRWVRMHPALKVFLRLAKNVLGAVLVAMGVAMLVLPGQGILTILLGVMLLEFPGKYRLERWLAGRAAVFRALNWVRRRVGVAPIAPPRGFRG